MAPKDPNDCVVTVTIEMGHQANFLKEPSPEGFTHDWTVFVRGFEGSRLEYFVEKVVFKLHKTFKSPVRVITEPPFRVTESGYAGFILPIEIHFKNKQTPRKIVFSYDLFLNAKDSPPINNVRYEKLKFQNPTPEFKAKLIKAGGVEQGPEHPSSDHFGSPVRSEKRALPKIPKDKDKDKEKVKQKKKSSPQFKSASPAPSLSSLSPMSSDNEDSYTVPPPPPPVKKEKELSVKRDGSSSVASQSKQDSSSSHKDKSKHRSSSSNSFHKERSDKDASHKSHQHKDKTKERDRSSSHKDKEAVKKDKDSNSQKVVKEHFESRKEREGSHSSGKSSTSSQHDNKVAVQPSHKEREKSLQSRDKDTLVSSKEKMHSSSRDREKISKEKHTSHKDVSHTSHSAPKKVKEDISKEKVSKESDRHHKSHKRHVEPADDVEIKKLKRSSSVASTDEKSVKVKSSSGKEKHVSRDNKEKESSKEVKESKSSSSDKSKHEKSRHSEKPRHSHSSETKQKESSAKRPEMPQKQEKVSKPESLTHTERLAMTADFQPQLLLSPLKSKSDEEESPTPSPLVEKVELKSSTSHSSPSSAVSGEDKSDHEMMDTQADEDKHIVSGLTDSDSDSEEEAPYVKSQQKDLKSILNKQSQQANQVSKSSLQKVVRRSSAEEKQKKVEYEPTEDGARKSSKAEKKANITEPAKSKSVERKIDNSDADAEQVNAANNTDNQNCNGLDILAPNGMSIGDLIAINEQIEKAQTDLNQKLLERVIDIIGETDDFDISDVSLSFDICSVDKTVVLQIQALLKEYQLQCSS